VRQQWQQYASHVFATTAHLTWSAARIASEVMTTCGQSAAGSVTKVVVKGTPSDNGSTETANVEVTEYGYQTMATTFTLTDKSGEFIIGGVRCQPPP
jgi:hypothetical protein